MDELVALSGLRLRVRRFGHRGPPLLLLHGLGSSSHIWDLVVPLLADRARVYAVDGRGHGESDKPERGYGWAEMRGDAIELLDALELPSVALVGHSWGADVALDIAAHHPERVRALGLVDGGLVDFGAHLDWPEAEAFLSPPDLRGMSREELREQGRAWLGAGWRPEADAIVFSLYQAQADGSYAPRLERARHMEIVRALWEAKPHALYRRLRPPVTALLAVPPEPHDRYTANLVAWRREGLAALTRACPEARAVVLDETVHDIPIHRPERLAEEIAALLA